MSQVISVLIQSLDDVAAGKQLVSPEIAATLHEAEFVNLTILEGGTATKRTSVGIVARDTKTNEHVLIQCTAEMFQTLAGAVQGAVLRFEHDSHGK